MLSDWANGTWEWKDGKVIAKAYVLLVSHNKTCIQMYLGEQL